MNPERAKVLAEPCHCTRCSMCRGSGRVYKGFWDDAEPCEDCGGLGVTDSCDRCQLLAEMDHDDEDASSAGRSDDQAGVGHP